MRHLGPGAGGDERGEAGVAEQVEEPHRPVAAAGGGADRRLGVRPVGRLLGKDADMAERGEAAEIGEAVVGQRPGLAERRLREAPAAGALLLGVAGEDGVGAVPGGGRQPRRPDRLVLRPPHDERPVALELLAAAAVDQRVVGARLDGQHDRSAFGRARAGGGRKGEPLRRAAAVARAAVRRRRTRGRSGPVASTGTRARLARGGARTRSAPLARRRLRAFRLPRARQARLSSSR